MIPETESAAGEVGIVDDGVKAVRSAVGREAPERLLESPEA